MKEKIEKITFILQGFIKSDELLLAEIHYKVMDTLSDNYQIMDKATHKNETTITHKRRY